MGQQEHVLVDDMIERIECGSLLLAIVVRASHQGEGIQFFTPDDLSQQLAYMNRAKGYIIAPHLHNPVPREVEYTAETLFIKSGKVRIDFYDNQKKYLSSRIVIKGDVILLVHGGHGFEMLEASEIIEVKQGPYAGEGDKTRFVGVAPADLNIK